MFALITGECEVIGSSTTVDVFATHQEAHEEMDDPYLELERWVDLTVDLDLTVTVSVSLSAFEEDDMRDVMNDLLETSFRDKVLAMFREELAMDPYIEVGFVEEGRCANHIGDEEVACYLAERG